MNYNTVVEMANRELPEFKKEYENALSMDLVDDTLGAHSVFSLVFVPLLVESIKSNNILACRLFDFVEKMESCGDSEVAEVVEFTILEELCDLFDDSEIIDFLGDETKDALNSIRKYMPKAI